MKEKKGITGAGIKIIACISMFIDHTAAVFLERYLAAHGYYNIATLEDSYSFLAKYGNIYYLYAAMRLIGRLAFPLFIFMLVEGFTHTHCKWKYALRLLIFAFVAEIPFNLAFNYTFFYSGYQNVIFTIFLGFLFMWTADFLNQKQLPPMLGYLGIILSSLFTGYYLYDLSTSLTYNADFSLSSIPAALTIIGIGAAITVLVLILVNKHKSFNDLSINALSLLAAMVLAFAADLLNTDYGSAGIFAIAIAYTFRNDKKRSLAYSVCILTLSSVMELFALLDLILIKNYNGERGKTNKYSFYAFYPCHILLIHIVSHFLGY